jgi:hypothetical protein
MVFEKYGGKGGLSLPLSVKEKNILVKLPSGKPYRAAVFHISINCGIGQAYRK